MQPRRFLSIVSFVVLLALASFQSLPAETIATCGEGWLEKIDGQYVLHLKGSHYEMGYQHGALLKAHCEENLKYMLYEKGKSLVKVGNVTINPRPIVDSIARLQSKFVPPKYQQELEGLAAGSGMPLDDVISGNSIPEMFHCSGFAVMNSATADGTLYHGRVLDYACDWRLQEHAVLVVAEPNHGIPFVNVTYAGFIGSVTGMNAQHISIGEMGGRGLGHWEGIPMAYLVREVLETSRSLPEAISVFSDNPRTCEYYYVIADGETNEAVGLAATWDKLEQVQPGAHHDRLPRPVQDTVLLSAGDRYDALVDRVTNQHGKLDADTSRHLMDRGVAMKSNLHNVLFAPKSTDFWVAHASIEGKPAAEQPYHKFQLAELLQRKPDPGASVLELDLAAQRTASAQPATPLSQ